MEWASNRVCIFDQPALAKHAWDMSSASYTKRKHIEKPIKNKDCAKLIGLPRSFIPRPACGYSEDKKLWLMETEQFQKMEIASRMDETSGFRVQL